MNNEETGCCCGPMVEESDELKKLKPFLIGGVIIFAVLFIADITFLKGNFCFTYLMLGITLLIMTINRCYLAFFYFTFTYILYLFSTLLSQVGIFIQTKFEEEYSIIKFLVYLFAFIFTLVIYYYSFKAYKEMKYLFMNKAQNAPMIAGYGGGYTGEGNNNAGNNISNNSNNDSNKKSGFKAFSGKGYKVGGS